MTADIMKIFTLTGLHTVTETDYANWQGNDNSGNDNNCCHHNCKFYLLLF